MLTSFRERRKWDDCEGVPKFGCEDTHNCDIYIQALIKFVNILI